jgi:HSP20 family molecular chaperone IbpA
MESAPVRSFVSRTRTHRSSRIATSKLRRVPDQVDESNQPDSIDESNTATATATTASNTDDATSSNVVVEEQTTGTDTSDASAAPPQIEEPNQYGLPNDSHSLTNHNSSRRGRHRFHRSPRADVKKARSEAAEATDDAAAATDMAVDDSTTKEGQLKIKRVADDVEKIGVHVRNLHEIAESWHSTHGESEPETDERNIDALQRQTIAYSEALMRDLLTLDEIVGDELRPMRKHNVREVQSLLDDVDALRKRLVALHRDVKKRADAKRAERAAQEAEAAAAAAAAAKPAESSATPVVTDESEQAHTEEDPSSSDEGSSGGAPPALEQPIKPASESPGSVPWKSLRLEPEFHVNEADDGAIELVAYVPGLREKDIDIRLVDKGEQEQLEVAGLVLPTAAQAQQLWQSAVAMKQEDRRNGPHARFARTPVSALALRGGAGRFGTFQQRFALPRDAVSQDISASLQRGYLTVRIPRAVRRRAPVPQQRAARMPRGYQQPPQQQQYYGGVPQQQQQPSYGGRRGQQQQSPLFWW